MDEHGHTPEKNDPGYATFQQLCRARLQRYVASIVESGHDVRDALDLVAAHLDGAGTEERCQAMWDAQVMANVSQATRRILASLVAATHGIGNWTPAEMLEMGVAEHAYVPAVVAARLMVSNEIGEGDTVLLERLITTMEPQEINWLVCVAAGAIGGMGLPSQAVRELDPQWTVDAP